MVELSAQASWYLPLSLLSLAQLSPGLLLNIITSGRSDKMHCSSALLIAQTIFNLEFEG